MFCDLHVFSALLSQQNHVFQASHLSVASTPDGGEDGVNQERMSWEKEENSESLVAPQLPLHNLLHNIPPLEELQPISSSMPPESDWDSLMSAQQRMVSPTASIS